MGKKPSVGCENICSYGGRCMNILDSTIVSVDVRNTPVFLLGSVLL